MSANGSHGVTGGRAQGHQVLRETRLGAERLAGYTDAVLAIIATVLVVPLTKLDESSRREVAGIVVGRSLLEVLTSNYQLETLALYYATFMVVYTVWMGSSYSLNGMHDLDPLSVGACALELLFTCLLPFTAGTAGHAWSVAIDDAEETRQLQIPFYVNLVCVSASHVLVQILVGLKRKDVKLSRTLMLESLANFAITVAALVMKFCYLPLSFLPFLLMPLTSATARYITSKPKRNRGRSDVYTSAQTTERETTADEAASTDPLLRQQRQRTDSMSDAATATSTTIACSPSQAHVAGAGAEFEAQTDVDLSTLFNVDVDRSRLGVFTDGVVAIAVTILVLDVQPPAACGLIKDISTCILEHEAGCRLQPITKIRPGKVCYFDAEESATKLQLLIAAFILSFLLLNVLRSHHHVVFDQAKRSAVNIPLLALNAHFCFFVSLIPTAFGLVSTYVMLPFEGAHHGTDAAAVVSDAMQSQSPLLDADTNGMLDTSPDKHAGQTALGCVCVVLIASSSTLLAMLALRLRSSVAEAIKAGEEPPASQRRVWLQFLVMPVVASVDLVLVWMGVPAWMCLCVIVAIPAAVISMDAYEYLSTPLTTTGVTRFPVSRQNLSLLLNPHDDQSVEHQHGVSGQQHQGVYEPQSGYQTMDSSS